MKIMPLFFFLIAVQISLMIFTVSTTPQDGITAPWNNSSASIDGANAGYMWNGTNETYGNTDMWDMIFNPLKGGDTRMVQYLLLFLITVGAVGFIPFINRSDLSMLAGMAIFLLAPGIWTCVSLYTFVNQQVSSFVCDVMQTCFTSQLIGVLVAGPLLFAWVGAVLEWWSGRPIS